MQTEETDIIVENELQDFLNHQEAWCESVLGEVYYALKEEVEIE